MLIPLLRTHTHTSDREARTALVRICSVLTPDREDREPAGVQRRWTRKVCKNINDNFMLHKTIVQDRKGVQKWG